MDWIGDVQMLEWINSKGWRVTWFEACKGCLLLLPNWHEIQVDVLWKSDLETGRFFP
jgi:coenzyme F420-reducing hydrogenase gamma subunit